MTILDCISIPKLLGALMPITSEVCFLTRPGSYRQTCGCYTLPSRNQEYVVFYENNMQSEAKASKTINRQRPKQQSMKLLHQPFDQILSIHLHLLHLGNTSPTCYRIHLLRINGELVSRHRLSSAGD